MNREKRVEQEAKLTLAVLAHTVGEPLSMDIYYGDKLIASKGQPITRSLIFKLQHLELQNLRFVSESAKGTGAD